VAVSKTGDIRPLCSVISKVSISPIGAWNVPSRPISIYNIYRQIMEEAKCNRWHIAIVRGIMIAYCNLR
jgi:hypothetical protein